MAESVQLTHLITFNTDDTLDFRVTTTSYIIANEELVDKLIVAVHSQTHLICEVHRRIEELLVR